MFIPLAIVQYQSSESSWLVRNLMDNRSLVYNIVYVILIVAFTYFYTAITLNPQQMAEDMKRNNGFIPGIKPGHDTAEYIDTLEDLCIEKANICNLYVKIIGCQDKELLCQREQIVRMKEIQTAMKRQNSRLRDCEKVFTEYEENFSTCWIGRICAHLRRLIRLMRR